jgi:hypothetical protein
MWKAGAFLYEVITDQLKRVPLREDGGFVVDGAVLEAEHQMVSDSVTLGDLGQVAVGERLAFQSAQHQKPVNQTFRVTHGNGFRHKRGGLEHGCAGQQSRQYPEADTLHDYPLKKGVR